MKVTHRKMLSYLLGLVTGCAFLFIGKKKSRLEYDPTSKENNGFAMKALFL